MTGPKKDRFKCLITVLIFITFTVCYDIFVLPTLDKISSLITIFTISL